MYVNANESTLRWVEFDIVMTPLRKNNYPHFDSTFICFGAAFIHVKIGVIFSLF